MRLFVVDGYNVLRTTGRFSAIAESDLETARARLVSDVAAYVGPDEGAIVVFDGAQNANSDGTQHSIAGIDVVFSAYGRDADTVIEEIVAGKRESGDAIVLVTSDQTLQWTTMGSSVTRMSSAEFARDLADEGVDRQEYAEDGSTGTLDQRIDEKTRETLARWARGQMS